MKKVHVKRRRKVFKCKRKANSDMPMSKDSKKQNHCNTSAVELQSLIVEPSCVVHFDKVSMKVQCIGKVQQCEQWSEAAQCQSERVDDLGWG